MNSGSPLLLDDGPAATAWLLEHTINRLTEREAYVARRHLYDHATDSQIARELGVHRTTVQRTRRRALDSIECVMRHQQTRPN